MSAGPGSTAAALAGTGAAGRSPMQHLLHALNQPLTGLQCSIELALAMPRTPAQYVNCLREAMPLIERARMLAQAMRELVDIGEAETAQPEPVDWVSALQAAIDDLKPVADTKQISVSFHRHGGERFIRTARREFQTAIFRLLDACLSLAARRSTLQIEMADAASLRIDWQKQTPALSNVCPAELALLLAGATLQKGGSTWNREVSGDREVVRISFPPR